MSSLRFSRRTFLALTSGAVLGVSGFSLAESGACLAPDQGRLQLTDPNCPTGAYSDLMEYFREQRRQQKPIPDQQRLRDGRLWLAGQPVNELRQGETSSWLEVPARAPVKLRVLRPAGESKGVVLAIHGGGWAMGSALSDEKRNWDWARRAGVVVLSPEYRLAPENPYPAAPDDCEAAARWLLREGEATFGTSSFAISGASAGGHLAALTLQRLEPPLRRAFRCAVLYYGVYDLGRSKVWRESTDLEFPDLAPSDMNLFLNWFVPDLSDEARRDPRYSPLYGELEDVPPALFLVGGADLLAEDTRLLARRWAERGNKAELVEYPGAPHGFNGFDVSCGLNADHYAAEYLVHHL